MKRPNCRIRGARRFPSEAFQVASFQNATLVAVALILFLTLPYPIKAEIKLEINRVTIGEGSSVEFRTLSCGTVEGLSPDVLKEMEKETAGDYVVYFNPRAQFYRRGYFLYDFYVQPVSLMVGMSCFRVQAWPTGDFLDQTVDVRFVLGDNYRVAEFGPYKLPIYNKGLRQSLQAEENTIQVRSGTEKRQWIQLTNLHRDLPITVISEASFSRENEEYWEKREITILLPRGTTALEIPGQQQVSGLELTLRPKGWKAFGDSLFGFPLATDKPHQINEIRLNYYTPGGVLRTLGIKVPVRFQPSVWAWLLAMLVGSIVGCLLRLLFNGYGGGMVAWLKAVAIASLSTLVLDIVGIVLIAYDSHIRIFGIILDPYQLLQVMLLGVVIGLTGFRSAGAFLGFLKRARSGG